MGLFASLSKSVKGFSSIFWVANTLEVFERFAFYGAKAVLVVFLIDKVGLKNEAGSLAGFFTFLIYGLPILAGVLVDRYGFRRTLMACFAIFSVGYFLIGMAGMQWSAEIVAAIGNRTYIIIVLTFTAIGGSLIKPCIVGTVGRTSSADSRTLGFSIYYSLVNFGGAVGPVLAYFIRTDLGIEWVLITSSITCFLLFFGTMFFFREPPAAAGQPTEQKTFGRVFADMMTVFRDRKVMLFLLIFSAFWLMFWQIYYLIPVYAMDVLHYDQFEFLESVDGWFIMFFSLFMGTVFSKWKVFTALIFGFVVSSLSWILIMAYGTTWSVVVAIIFFALGEGTLSPRFYEYMYSLAPPSQTGTYMGFAFLPVAIGAFAAGFISDWLRLTYMETNPSMMWIILASIGIFSTVLLILYDRFLVKKT
ncbi:MAG TPA: MFS transporter [Cyclobacteriaceae bacterium]|nr:MFS transporter [Cyclobacteriaceae bacterium]